MLQSPSHNNTNAMMSGLAHSCHPGLDLLLVKPRTFLVPFVHLPMFAECQALSEALGIFPEAEKVPACKEFTFYGADVRHKASWKSKGMIPLL